MEQLSPRVRLVLFLGASSPCPFFPARKLPVIHLVTCVSMYSLNTHAPSNNMKMACQGGCFQQDPNTTLGTADKNMRPEKSAGPNKADARGPSKKREDSRGEPIIETYSYHYLHIQHRLHNQRMEKSRMIEQL